MPGWLAESLGISLAAQAATLPDVLATFGRLRSSPRRSTSPSCRWSRPRWPPACSRSRAGRSATLGAPALVATLVGLPAGLSLHVVIAIVRVGAALPFAARDAIPPESPSRRGSSRAPPPRAPRVIAGDRGAGVAARPPIAPRRPGPRAASARAAAAAAPRRATRRALVAAVDPRRSVAARRRRGPAEPRGSRCSTSGRATRSCSRAAAAPGCSSTAARTPTGSSSRSTRGSRHGTAGSTSSSSPTRTRTTSPGSRAPRALPRRAASTSPACAGPGPAGGVARGAAATARPAARSPPGARLRLGEVRCPSCGRPAGGAARAPDTGHRDQQRLDRAARRGVGPPVPPDGRRRGRHRPGLARPRPAAGRPAQGRAPRQPHGDDAGVRGCRATAGGRRVGRGGQHLRPPGQGRRSTGWASGARVYRTDQDGSVAVELGEDGLHVSATGARAGVPAIAARAPRPTPATHGRRSRTPAPSRSRPAPRSGRRAPDARPRDGLASRIGRLGRPYRLRSFA